RRREFFNVPVFRSEPRDRSCILFARDQLPAAAADWRIRVVVDLASRNIGRLRVKQPGERAQDAALGLPPQSEQDEIVARQDRVYDLRHNGIVVTHDSRKYWTSLAQARHQVLAHLVFDFASRETLLGEWTLAQLA